MSADTPLRLLISDVDGTLVRTDKSLADATVAAVHRLTAAGLPMSLISARPPSGMYWIAEKLDLDGPFGAFNGGVLFKRDGTVIERHCLDRSLAEAMIALIAEAGITCWVFADDEWLSNSDTDPHNPREVKSANVEPVITEDFSDKLDRIDKIVGVSDDHDLLVDLEAKAIATAGKSATIARSQPYYLDVTAPVANKGDGISFLANAFGVALADVAVIGDQTNDLPMFARAGLSIAMGQATDAVKAKAMLVTGSSDADGVAAAIDTIILPRVRD
jgi:Cof subfamily protein (haloacid dehalogenase superfamily)